MHAHSEPGPRRRPADLVHRLAGRLSGPGGLYNIGNMLALLSGCWLAVRAGGQMGTAGEALLDHLAGSGSAVALTSATLVFLVSGEVYHAAFAGPAADARLTRTGDLLSAIGAVLLGLALALLGDPWLALTAGLLHALGKLGSALHRPGARYPFWPARWPDPCRSAVLASRVPAVLAALAQLARAGGSVESLVAPLSLLACYLLWAAADLLLFRPAA